MQSTIISFFERRVKEASLSFQKETDLLLSGTLPQDNDSLDKTSIIMENG